MEGVNGLISEKHSLKRVRFERKTIERDSESPYAERQLSHFTPYDRLLEKERRIRKPYSLYRNSAESGVLLNHHNNLRVESDRGKVPYERSQIDQTYIAHLPKLGRDSGFEELQMQNYPTSSSLLPWSRVYRMTQSTEPLTNSYQPKVYGTYSLSDSYGRGGVSSERRHYMVRWFLQHETIEGIFNTSYHLTLTLRRLLIVPGLHSLHSVVYSYFCMERGTVKALFLSKKTRKKAQSKPRSQSRTVWASLHFSLAICRAIALLNGNTKGTYWPLMN